MQSGTGNTLLVMTPQPGRSLPPANHPVETTSDVQHRSAGEPLPASADRQTETVVSGNPPEGNHLATAEVNPAAPPPTVNGDLPDIRAGESVAALAPADEKPAVPPAAGLAVRPCCSVE